MEVKWTEWLEENSAEHYGIEFPVKGGRMEYTIGRTKDAKFFYGDFYDCNDFPDDPFGDVYVFENENTMRINLFHHAEKYDLGDDTMLSQDIAKELWSAYEDL